MDLQARVSAVIRQHVRRGDRLVAGLSGGVDSMVLVDVLRRLSRKIGCALAAVHVNHQINPAAGRFSCKRAQKGVSGPLARPAKRHYTFARRRLDRTRSVATSTAHQAHKALIFRLFCSLRLSVRTPPFHGGESGSIPLGSAIQPSIILFSFQFLSISPNGLRRFGKTCSLYGH